MSHTLLFHPQVLFKALREKEKVGENAGEKKQNKTKITSSFSHKFLYPVKDKFHLLNCIQNAFGKCFGFGSDENFVVWYRFRIQKAFEVSEKKRTKETEYISLDGTSTV